MFINRIIRQVCIILETNKILTEVKIHANETKNLISSFTLSSQLSCRMEI